MLFRRFDDVLHYELHEGHSLGKNRRNERRPSAHFLRSGREIWVCPSHFRPMSAEEKKRLEPVSDRFSSMLLPASHESGITQALLPKGVRADRIALPASTTPGQGYRHGCWRYLELKLELKPAPEPEFIVAHPPPRTRVKANNSATKNRYRDIAILLVRNKNSIRNRIDYQAADTAVTGRINL